ncbi:MAG: hypothetical protein ACYDHF_06350 [Candidatus Cryosericum sp.]
MLDVALRVVDRATKWAEGQIKAAAQAHGNALGSAGFRLKQLTSEGMRQQAPGDVIWPQPSPWVQFGPSLAGRARTQQRRLSRRKRAPENPALLYGTAGRTPLRKLAAGARYQKSGSDGEVRVLIGFLNPRLAAIAAYHAEAHTVPVTERMRRLIFAVGLGIGKKTITIPKREHVGAVYRRNQARVSGFCQQRINAALAGRNPKSISF